MPKRIFSILLTCAMLLSIVPTAMAGEEAIDLIHEADGSVKSTVSVKNGGYKSKDGADAFENYTEDGSVSNAIDGNKGTAFYLHAYMPYTQIDLGSVKELSEITYDMDPGRMEYFRREFDVFASNDVNFKSGVEKLLTVDNLNWVSTIPSSYTIKFEEGGSDETVAIKYDSISGTEPINVTVSPKKYRYVRIQKNNGLASHTGMSVSEISIKGFDILGTNVESTTIPEGESGVTNTDKTELYTVSFKDSIDLSSVTSSTIYAERKVPVYETGENKWQQVKINPVPMDGYTVGLDISKLKSYNTYRIVVSDGVTGTDGIGVVPFTSGEFTTGIIAPVTYSEEERIVNVAKGSSAYVLKYNGSSYDKTGTPHLTDGNLSGDTGDLISNQHKGVDVFSDSNNQFYVIDLGSAKTVKGVGVLGMDRCWYHFAPFDVYGTNTDPSNLSNVTTEATKLGAITKAMVIDWLTAVSMWGQGVAGGGKWSETKAPAVSVSNDTPYRYVLLVATADGSKAPIEAFVYSGVGDSFGEWSISDNAEKTERTFSVPVEYLNPSNVKDFDMVITNYDKDGKMTQTKTVKNLYGDTLTGTISITEVDTKSVAALIPAGGDYSFVAPVAYYGFGGFNENNGSADSFENALSMNVGDSSAKISGKTVEPSDRITVSVVKSDAKNAEEAFSGVTEYFWYGTADSDIGYGFTIPFGENGKYYVKATRYATDNTVESKYYSYNVVDSTTKAEAIENIVNAASAKDFNDALKAAADDLGIISKDSLIEEAPATDKNGYLDTFADIYGILGEGEVSAAELVKIINTAVVANALKNNDNSYMEEHSDLIVKNQKVKEYVEKELKYSFTADVTSTVANASGVTNIDSEGIMTFNFSEKMDVSTLTASNISIKSGEDTVDVKIVDADENKITIDKSTLKSNSNCTITFSNTLKTASGYKMAQDKVINFKTGQILNHPYKKGMTLRNVALNKEVIAPNGTTGSAGFSTNKQELVDGAGLDGKGNVVHFNGGKIIIDLGAYYEIAEIAFYGNRSDWPWHYYGITYRGSAYDAYDENEYKVLYSTPASSDCPIKYSAPVNNIGKIRYLWVNKPDSALLAREVAAYAYVSDTGLGSWEVQEFGGSGNYTFKIPAVDTTGNYTMVVSAYDEKGLTKASAVQTVSAESGELSATVNAPSGTKGIKAMLVKDVKGMAQVMDSVIIGEDIANAASVEDGWKITNDDDNIFINIGAVDGVKKADQASVTVIKSTGTGIEPEDKFNALTEAELSSNLVFLNCGKAGKGMNNTLSSLPEGKYFVKVTASDENGNVLKNAYYKYARVANSDKETTIDNFMNGDHTTIKDTVQEAVNEDEIISKDMLGDTSVMDNEEYYQNVEYVIDMLYPEDKDKAEVKTLSEVSDILNASALVNSFGGTNSEKTKQLSESYAEILGDHFDANVNIERFNKVYANLKSNVNSGKTLSETLDWSGMLSYIQDGTNKEKADALTKYATEFGIDLKYASNKGVSLERATEYLDGSNAAEYYGKDKIGAAYKAAVDKAYLEIVGGASRPVSGGNGGGSSTASGSNKKPIPTITETKVPEYKEPVVDNKTPFSDMANFTWANDAVNKLCDQKVLSGYGDGTLKPEGYVTRAEFVKMLAVATKVKVVENAPMSFMDVEDDSWYFPYVRIAFTNGICSGVSKFNFNPDGYITRQDMAVMIYNYMKLVGKGGTGEEKTFTDADKIADYAKDAVKMTSKAGIINGFDDGTFKPSDNARRVDAAMMISKVID